MPGINVNFADAQGFEPLPPDRYEVRLAEVTEQTSKAGNPMVVFRFEVQDEGEFFGRYLWINAALTPRALWRFAQVLIALEELPEDFDVNDTDALKALGDVELEPDEQIGKEVTVETALQDYNGRMTENVVAMWPSGKAPEHVPVSPSASSNF